MTRAEELQKQLAEKRAANEAKAKIDEEAAALEALERDIEIEDAIEKAYANGLKDSQLVDITFRGVGRSLARIPQDAQWRKFCKKSGILKGELDGDPMVHEELVNAVMLAPDGKKFLELARNRNPHAVFDITSAISAAMRGERAKEGK